jgi:hypothetical protein
MSQQWGREPGLALLGITSSVPPRYRCQKGRGSEALANLHLSAELSYHEAALG